MIKDESRVDEVLDALRKLQTGYVEIGILGDSESDILLIASVNEFGASISVTDKMRGYLHSQGLHLKKTTKEIRIPERSFIRGSFDENIGKISDKAEDLINSVVSLEISPESFFKTIGIMGVSAIQEYMRDLKQPSNHPYTIQRKGSSNPLVDSGRLIQSIDFNVKYR